MPEPDAELSFEGAAGVGVDVVGISAFAAQLEEAGATVELK